MATADSPRRPTIPGALDSERLPEYFRGMAPYLTESEYRELVKWAPDILEPSRGKISSYLSWRELVLLSRLAKPLFEAFHYAQQARIMHTPSVAPVSLKAYVRNRFAERAARIEESTLVTCRMLAKYHEGFALPPKG